MDSTITPAPRAADDASQLKTSVADIIQSLFDCASCRAADLHVIPFHLSGRDLVDAVVACETCHRWYRLEDGVLEMVVPALANAGANQRFQSRFASRWDGWKRAPVADVQASALNTDGSSPETHKLDQKAFFDDEAIRYEGEMIKLPFWRAFDVTYLHELGDIGDRATRVLLEVGGGTGRMSLPICGRFSLVLSFDLSESMVRKAMRNRAAKGLDASHVFFFVADAENIPIRDGVADVASLSGILHHVSMPGIVLRETSRVLKTGGAVIGNENNRSAMRFLFDWLMSLRRLWREKAHEHHFIMSSGELQEWFRSAGFAGHTWTSVFLPPHAFNLLTPALALRLLRITDTAARALPWIRRQGGLVLYRGTKMESPRPSSGLDQRSY